MDNNLQTNNERPTIGAGIITLSVLHFIGIFFVCVGVVLSFTFKDAIQQYSGVSFTETTIILTLVIELVLLAALILLLRRKKLGVYLYYTVAVLSLANNIIFSGGFSIANIITPLVLPIIMFFFIKNKFKYFT